ncbi:MAG: hypothetical protein J6Y25_00970 [Elusimicrobiaceae bacterium]|nr:hypothetical protein [Elusimicrobiaceae bacterium]
MMKLLVAVCFIGTLACPSVAQRFPKKGKPKLSAIKKANKRVVRPPKVRLPQIFKAKKQTPVATRPSQLPNVENLTGRTLGQMPGLANQVNRAVASSSRQAVSLSAIVQAQTRPIEGIRLVSLKDGLTDVFPRFKDELKRANPARPTEKLGEELLALEDAFIATDKEFFIQKQDGIHVNKDAVVRYGSYKAMWYSHVPFYVDLQVYLSEEGPLKAAFRLRERQILQSLKQQP